MSLGTPRIVNPEALTRRELRLARGPFHVKLTHRQYSARSSEARLKKKSITIDNFGPGSISSTACGFRDDSRILLVCTLCLHAEYVLQHIRTRAACVYQSGVSQTGGGSFLTMASSLTGQFDIPTMKALHDSTTVFNELDGLCDWNSYNFDYAV